MASFNDSEGREYKLKLTIGLARIIRDATTVDLAGDFEKSVTTFTGDPYAFCNVLFHWAKHTGQFDGDEAAFANTMDRDTVEAALPAVVDAVVDFFPKEKRELLKKIVAKGKELETETAAKMMELVDEGTEKVKAKLREQSGESFTTFLDGLGSTRIRTPSAN
jgi:hypothetical protein